VAVICVGDVMVDVLAQLPGELAVGSDTPAGISLLGGGSAANTAAWLVAAGTAATFVGRVGDDALGRKAIDDLARAGVDLAVTVDAALPTGTCIVLVDPYGERTMVPSAGANSVGGVPPAFGPGDHLHVSGYALFHPRSATAVGSAISAARAAGCTLSVDAASSAPLRAFGAERFLDAIAPALVFANCDEATVLAGSDDPAEAARRVGARCGEAVVKCGGDGAVWSDGSDVVRATPSLLAPIDSTGAGDAFAAGVLAARLAGADLPTALSAGNALAARAISQRGARP
jgi:sugar/nucleoside kinase (ribokinase family)